MYLTIWEGNLILSTQNGDHVTEPFGPTLSVEPRGTYSFGRLENFGQHHASTVVSDLE